MKIIERLKPTTFLILGILIFLFSIVMIIYYMPRNGGESMYALWYMAFLGISVIMIIIDRILVTFNKNLILISLGELLFLLVALFLIINSQKRAKVIFTNPKYNFISIIYSDNGVDKKAFVNGDMLDKELYVKDTNIIVINKKSLSGFYIYGCSPQKEGGVEIVEFEYKNKKIEIQLSDNIKWTEHKEDSIINFIKSKIK